MSCNTLFSSVDGTADGTVLLQRPEPGKDAQLWVLDGDTVKNRKDARVLDITAASTGCGAVICAWKLHGGPNQKWDVVLAYVDYAQSNLHLDDNVFA